MCHGCRQTQGQGHAHRLERFALGRASLITVAPLVLQVLLHGTIGTGKCLWLDNNLIPSVFREPLRYFHTQEVLPNTRPNGNITLVVGTLLQRPYRITIGQKCFTIVRDYTRHQNKNFLLNVFVLSKTELHHSKNVFVSLGVSDFALKQKQNVIVSLSFQWFGSETKALIFPLSCHHSSAPFDSFRRKNKADDYYSSYCQLSNDGKMRYITHLNILQTLKC